MRTDPAPLSGLLLVGGKSTRMRRDKSRLEYHGKPQWQHGAELLSRFCSRVFLSVRGTEGWEDSGFPLLKDQHTDIGPMGGILSALAESPDSAWLVLACDLPFVNEETLDLLLKKRNLKKLATAFKSRFDGLPEPLCTIYEPESRPRLLHFLKEGHHCPRKALIHSDIELLPPVEDRSLDNVNTFGEYGEAMKCLTPEPPKNITLDYFALLREERGCDHESISTRARTLEELYLELKEKHHFSLGLHSLRVAVNEVFCQWPDPLKNQDRVVFIPPVSGG